MGGHTSEGVSSSSLSSHLGMLKKVLPRLRSSLAFQKKKNQYCINLFTNAYHSPIISVVLARRISSYTIMAEVLRGLQQG